MTITKSAIHQLVDTIQDEQFLSAVFTILEKQATSEADFWHTLPEEQKAAILQGIADADLGRFKPVKDVLAKYQ